MTASEASLANDIANTKLRVGVVCDFQEENWPSMELVADMLLAHLADAHGQTVNATRIQPAMRMRFAKLKQHGSNGDSASGLHNGPSANRTRFNADRVINRFWDYPRHLGRLKKEFDLFHLVDHSYAQLLHELPPERTIVTCHDLDTFQCLLNPTDQPRSLLFKKIMSRTLNGFRKAARVTCDSEATRDGLLANGLVDAGRTVVIPNGVHETCSPNPDPLADAEADRLLGSSDSVDILHVGSTIPRKRIDVLLRVFAGVREQIPNARLLRVGGPFTAEQTKLAHELNVTHSIVHLSQLDRRTLAALYRRATIVLFPSEREGFGLPVVEAMACGTPVLASDLAVLREVGGDAAVYCRLADVDYWVRTVAGLLLDWQARPDAWADRCAAGLAQASKFTWAEYARKTVDVYRSVLERPGVS